MDSHTPADTIYLSPHLDDVALSCGGQVWQQVQAGKRVLVVTVFAGSPPAGLVLSPFAQELHDTWQLNADAPAGRRQEDEAAMARLGAETAHWAFVDCIYRQVNGDFPYTGDEALFGKVHAAETPLVTEIAQRIAELPLNVGGVLYAPLAVGNHVDHQILRRAAEMTGARVLHYEDYPYAEDRAALQRALGQGRWLIEVTAVPEEALKARIAAVACYRSQLTMLGWPEEADMAAAIRAFAGLTGQGRAAERYRERVR